MDDDKIIELYLNRNEDAIKQTQQKFSGYCKKIASNILSDNQDIEECLNDTLMALWQSIPPARPDKLRAFIAKITRNKALGRLDYNTAGKRNSELKLILSELGECIASNENIESKIESNETIKVINEFLYDTNVLARNIFIRRYWYAESIKDISVRFSISESRVKSSLFRSRNKLKICLLEESLNNE